MGDLLGLLVGEVDLLAEFLVTADDGLLYGLVLDALSGGLLGPCEFVGDVHAGGEEVDDLCVDILDLFPEFSGGCRLHAIAPLNARAYKNVCPHTF